MKKFVSVLLIVCLMVASLIPIGAQAEAKEYVVVKKDNAPVRTGPSENKAVAGRCEKGNVLEVLGSTVNSHSNLWYKVRYNGGSHYIYSGNVDQHKHSYEKYVYDGVKYSVCPVCGNATVTLTESARISKSDAYAIPTYISTGIGLGVLDGPLPAGDMIGALIIALGYVHSVAEPTEYIATEITQELVAYMENNPSVCNSASFYQVQRVTNGLKKVDGKCLTIPEAYALVRAGVDVWTEYEMNAHILARIYGSCYSEIDQAKNGGSGPAPGYYHHYHLGANAKQKVKGAGHIFYGQSAVYRDRPW